MKMVTKLKTVCHLPKFPVFKCWRFRQRHCIRRQSYSDIIVWLWLETVWWRHCVDKNKSDTDTEQQLQCNNDIRCHTVHLDSKDTKQTLAITNVVNKETELVERIRGFHVNVLYKSTFDIWHLSKSRQSSGMCRGKVNIMLYFFNQLANVTTSYAKFQRQNLWKFIAELSYKLYAFLLNSITTLKEFLLNTSNGSR